MCILRSLKSAKIISALWMTDFFNNNSSDMNLFCNNKFIIGVLLYHDVVVMVDGSV